MLLTLHFIGVGPSHTEVTTCHCFEVIQVEKRKRKVRVVKDTSPEKKSKTDEMCTQNNAARNRIKTTNQSEKANLNELWQHIKSLHGAFRRAVPLCKNKRRTENQIYLIHE